MRAVAESPRVLVASAVEASGRVGLLADVAAVAAAGGRAVAILTAVTAQGRHFRRASVSPALVRAQLDAALESGDVAAGKMGMVPDARTLGLLWPRLLALGVPLVVDPVVRTSRGERLSSLRPEDYRALAGPAVWLTPNMEELCWLLGRPRRPDSVQEATELGAALLADGFAAVVVKGGHLPGPPTDVLLSTARVVRFAGSRLPRSAEKRGTGCRFAATLATWLGRGEDGATAVQGARRAVRRYLRAQ